MHVVTLTLRNWREGGSIQITTRYSSSQTVEAVGCLIAGETRNYRNKDGE